MRRLAGGSLCTAEARGEGATASAVAFLAARPSGATRELALPAMAVAGCSLELRAHLRVYGYCPVSFESKGL